MITTLSSRFASISAQAQASSSRYAHCYHPSFSPLYQHFISMICDVCFPFVHDIDELAYIAAACWPAFVKPLLVSGASPDDVAPSEDTRLRLIRAFTPRVTHALESLYPRSMNAQDWSAANDEDISFSNELHAPTSVPPLQDSIHSLPRMSRFILLASYIASTNPAKSDLRMFGRGVDEKKRRRGRARTTTKGPSKVKRLVSEFFCLLTWL